MSNLRKFYESSLSLNLSDREILARCILRSLLCQGKQQTHGFMECPVRLLGPHNMYLCADKHKEWQAVGDRKQPARWESFLMQYIGDDEKGNRNVRFLSIHGTYLHVLPNGSITSAPGNEDVECQTFTLLSLANEKFNLKTKGGFLHFLPEGTVEINPNSKSDIHLIFLDVELEHVKDLEDPQYEEYPTKYRRLNNGNGTAVVKEKTPAENTFRNYEDSAFQDRVVKTYHDMHINQTVDYVSQKLSQYRTAPQYKRTVWSTMQLLDTILDESDPDNDLPQIYHAYQTANSLVTRYFEDGFGPLRKDISIRGLFSTKEWELLPKQAKDIYDGKNLHEMYPDLKEWDWLPLIGFIHDLGKVLLLPEYGGLPQWSVTGDTFVVGCSFDESNVFSEKNFYHQNPDSKNEKYSNHGIYSKHCGLRKLLLSYGHDEYMAMVLEMSPNTLPPEAIYIIRFHSFYPWHTPKREVRGYEYFADEYDWRMLPILRAHQKADLYSKSTSIPPITEVQERYGNLIQKYFENGTLSWPIPSTN